MSEDEKINDCGKWEPSKGFLYSEETIKTRVNTSNLIAGIIAGALATFAFLPSVARCYFRKDPIRSPISLYTLSLSLTGQLLWIYYSIKVGDYILSIYASIASILFFMLLLSKKIFLPSLE